MFAVCVAVFTTRCTTCVHARVRFQRSAATPTTNNQQPTTNNNQEQEPRRKERGQRTATARHVVTCRTPRGQEGRHGWEAQAPRCRLKARGVSVFLLHVLFLLAHIYQRWGGGGEGVVFSNSNTSNNNTNNNNSFLLFPDLLPSPPSPFFPQLPHNPMGVGAQPHLHCGR